MHRTCHARHVPPRTTHNPLPLTRRMAIPKNQLRLARLATQPSNLRALHPKLPHPPRHPTPRKNHLYNNSMGNNPTFCLHRQPNLAKNPTHFHRNLRNNSHSFVQNAPKIVLYII